MGNQIPVPIQRHTTIDQLRWALGGVDPAALTNADVRALLGLVQASMKARGIE